MNDNATSEPFPYMNMFDKLCALLAFPFGLLLLILGVIGLFAGSSANFSLPPVLGVIPAFVGWGIMRAIYFSWNSARTKFEFDDPYNLPGQGSRRSMEEWSERQK